MSHLKAAQLNKKYSFFSAFCNGDGPSDLNKMSHQLWILKKKYFNHSFLQKRQYDLLLSLNLLNQVKCWRFWFFYQILSWLFSNIFNRNFRTADGYLTTFGIQNGLYFGPKIRQEQTLYRYDPKYSDRQAWAKQSDQGQHCLPLRLHLLCPLLYGKTTLLNF